MKKEIHSVALPLTHWVRVSTLNSELTDTAGLTFLFVWRSAVDWNYRQLTMPTWHYVGSMNANLASWDLTTELSPWPQESLLEMK